MSEDGKKRKSETNFWSIPTVKKILVTRKKKIYIYIQKGTTH